VQTVAEVLGMRLMMMRMQWLGPCQDTGMEQQLAGEVEVDPPSHNRLLQVG
jgi:hypothetical protein